MSIQRDHLTIDYAESGQGKPTLLFIHGAFIDKSYWDSQVRYFSEQYHIVTIDLPGHGKSGKNRDAWTVEEFGKDVVEVIRQLNLKDVILIGHSLGAAAILEAAVAYPQPIRGFIGIDMFKNAATPFPEEIQAQVHTLLDNFRKDFANTSESYARLVLLTEATDSEITRRVVKDYRNADPNMGVGALTSVFNYWERERTLLQQMPFKMYLILCDYLPTHEEPLKVYAKSGYEITPIHASSHFPMIEVPNELNTLLQQTIDKIMKNAQPYLHSR